VDAEESIPELLARLEREHVQAAYVTASGEPCCLECQEAWPCDVARVVAHARSLEAAIRKLEAAKETNEGIEFGFKYVPVEDAYYDLLDILGEAQ
jgi:hypothetical protein